MRDTDYEADLRRYPRRPFLKEQSAWAVAVYRFGRRVDVVFGLARRVGLLLGSGAGARGGGSGGPVSFVGPRGAALPPGHDGSADAKGDG